MSQVPSMDSKTRSRPFSILGVQQIAIGHQSKQKLRHLWVELLGLKDVHSYVNPAENVDEDVVTPGMGIWDVEIDLMQPIHLQSKPRVHEPPLHHIGLWVDDLPAAVEWLQAQGVRFVPGGIRKGAAGFDICFIHPKANEEAPVGGEGVLIELVQAPSKIKQAFTTLQQFFRSQAQQQSD